MSGAATETLENLELTLLLEGLFQHYGYDFRDYARASLKRRILGRVQEEGLRTVSELQARALHDPAVFERLLLGLTIHVTAMFRDPGFYAALRAQVVPLLRTYPFVRCWVAGSSSGEEVYSLAILLEEEGLYPRSRIYATDLNEAVIEKARAGVFPLASMQQFTDNYQKAGGRRAFSDYYSADHQLAVMASKLKKHIVFAQHNLAIDGSFNEFNLILCRNVMIYFNKALQDRVHHLIYESLAPLGALCVGRSESLRFTAREAEYDELNAKERIYRRR